ncbi:hypothetical protein D921_02018 [Enterococcus faecalis F01966]|nr:hypothetical protein D921_02018 [Enterococcus faecalis F01966]
MKSAAMLTILRFINGFFLFLKNCFGIRLFRNTVRQDFTIK